MASGEMSADVFTQFLYQSHQLMATHAEDGAIIYSCMDWRHMTELSTAAAKAQLDLQNLCVWVKDNGGMGSFYRSRHELVFVFKKGAAAHTNNIQLGKHGRYRTNVWEYPGVNSFAGGRMQELACTRPSNRWRLLQMQSRMHLRVQGLFWTRLAALAQPLWLRKRPAARRA